MENEKFNAMVKELVSGYILQGLSLNEAVAKLAETVKASLLSGGIYEELHGKALQVPAADKAQAAPAYSSRVNLEVTSVELKTKLPVDRNLTIGVIKYALKGRKLSYSVRGGRGTSWGWITIDLKPAAYKNMSPAEHRAALGDLNERFGLPRCGSAIMIPASYDYYREYMDRAAGRTPSKLGEPYWD